MMFFWVFSPNYHESLKAPKKKSPILVLRGLLTLSITPSITIHENPQRRQRQGCAGLSSHSLHIAQRVEGRHLPWKHMANVWKMYGKQTQKLHGAGIFTYIYPRDWEHIENIENIWKYSGIQLYGKCMDIYIYTPKSWEFMMG